MGKLLGVILNVCVWIAYEYADSSRTYELTYIQQELPPVLEASVVGSTLVMNLDKAREVFKQTFKKRFWG